MRLRRTRGPLRPPGPRLRTEVPSGENRSDPPFGSARARPHPGLCPFALLAGPVRSPPVRCMGRRDPTRAGPPDHAQAVKGTTPPTTTPVGFPPEGYGAPVRGVTNRSPIARAVYRAARPGARPRECLTPAPRFTVLGLVGPEAAYIHGFRPLHASRFDYRRWDVHTRPWDVVRGSRWTKSPTCGSFRRDAAPLPSPWVRQANPQPPDPPLPGVRAVPRRRPCARGDR